MPNPGPASTTTANLVPVYASTDAAGVPNGGIVASGQTPAGVFTAAQAQQAIASLARSVPNVVSPYDLRGDSFTVGFGLTNNSQSIGPLIASALNGTCLQNGISAAGVISQLGYSIFGNGQIGGGPPGFANLSTRTVFMLPGFNEMRQGVGAGNLSAYTGALACVAAIGASNLSAWRQFYNGDSGGVVFGAPASSMVRSGFSSISGYGLANYWRGVFSTTNAETITFTVQGDVVYIIYDRIKTLTGGTFSVSIDGAVAIASVSCDGTGLATVTATDAVVADNTLNGYPTLLRIPTTPGRHSVLITVTSATNASNKVQIEGCAGNEDMFGPVGVMTSVLRMNAAGYLASTAAYASAAAGDAANAIYTRINRGIADMLYGDGLNVGFVSINAFDPASVPAQIQSDNIHPTTTGTAALAAAVLGGLSARSIRQRNEYWQPTYAPTVGASPYTYTNNTQGDLSVLVTGGTVTAIDYTRNGTTFLSIAAASPGNITLSPGDAVRTTYAVAPTITIVPR